MASGKDQLKLIFGRYGKALDELGLGETMDEIADYVKTRIVAKARGGKSLTQGTEQPIKALSPNYIEQRRKWKQAMGKAVHEVRKSRGYPKDMMLPGKPGWKEALSLAQSRTPDLDPQFFSPARSNLTVTGQYLSSIDVTKVDRKKATALIEPTGNRKGESLTNKKLAGYLAKQGRSIFGRLDPTTQKVVVSKAKTALRTAIRKNLLRK